VIYVFKITRRAPDGRTELEFKDVDTSDVLLYVHEHMTHDKNVVDFRYWPKDEDH
jgi:hypothetical protein